MNHKIAGTTKSMVFVVLTAVTFLAACNNSSKPEETKEVSEIQGTEADYSLIGKKAIITYDDFRVEVTYISDSTLHWKTSDPGNVLRDDDEKISYKQLNGHKYFLNWVESDGFTVSQVVDTKENKVVSFVSFADDKSDRGKRGSVMMEGKIEFVD